MFNRRAAGKSKQKTNGAQDEEGFADTEASDDKGDEGEDEKDEDEDDRDEEDNGDDD